MISVSTSTPPRARAYGDGFVWASRRVTLRLRLLLVGVPSQPAAYDVQPGLEEPG